MPHGSDFKFGALLTGGLCALGLFPSLIAAYIGLLWVSGLEGRDALSALAMIALPFPVAGGALAGFQAVRSSDRNLYRLSLAFAFIGVMLVIVFMTWGGRMLR